MKSASSNSQVDLRDKISYLFKLFAMRLRGRNDSIMPKQDIDRYSEYAVKYLSKQIRDINILEIGYGARPWRMISLLSLGCNVKGVDLDQPAIGFNFTRLIKSFRSNGPERFVKSCVRSILFDGSDLRKLKKELIENGANIQYDPSAFHVGNASKSELFNESSFEMCYSEDVFEHVDKASLAQIVKNMYIWLKPGGIAFVLQNVYSGIAGGHDPEFYPHMVLANKINPALAWRHLWDPDFKVNTYLNRLRLKEYTDLFAPYFDILETSQRNENLGAQYLTDEVTEKVPGFTRDELLTNQIGFVLRSKKVAL